MSGFRIERMRYLILLIFTFSLCSYYTPLPKWYKQIYDERGEIKYISLREAHKSFVESMITEKEG